MSNIESDENVRGSSIRVRRIRVPSIRAKASKVSLVDQFSWNADQMSENRLIEELQNLNYLIENAVLQAMNVVLSKKFKDTRSEKIHQMSLETLHSLGPMREIYMQLISVDDPPNVAKQDLLAESLLRNQIFQLLFEAFFTGHFFCGISEPTRTVLESSFEFIRENGKRIECLNTKKYTKLRLFVESHIASQRWRSMAITAAFATSGSTPQLEDVTTSITDEIRRTFLRAFPYRTKNFKRRIDEYLHTAKDGLHEIVRKAHEFSLSIQRDIVSSFVKVTCGSHSFGACESFEARRAIGAWNNDMNSKKGDRVLGTFEFGLEQVASDGKTKILVKPIVITDALLRSKL